MSNEVVNYDPNVFYEELNRLGHDPQEYNRLLAKVIGDLQKQNIQWDNGVPYVFDPYTLKWVSTARPILVSSYYGRNQSSRYLKIGEVPSAEQQGFFVPRKAIVTGLWGKSRSVGNWILELRRNGSPITLASVVISGSFGSVIGLDVELNQDDWIQLYMNGTKVDYPIAGIELSWRL